MGRLAAGYQSEAKPSTHMRSALGQAYATVAPPGSASCGSCYVWLAQRMHCEVSAKGGRMNKPAKEVLERVAPYFKAAIAREKAKQAKCKKGVRDE